MAHSSISSIKSGRQVLVDTARTEVSRVQTRTTGPLVKDTSAFRALQSPRTGGVSAPTSKRLRCHVEQVVQNAADLAIQHANKARHGAALPHLSAFQSPRHQACSWFIVRDIIKAVKVQQVLQIGPALHELFRATVQQADMRITPLNNLTVKLQNKTQNAVRRRVLRTKVQVESCEFSARPSTASSKLVKRPSFRALAFFIAWKDVVRRPPTGDMKSNCRYSCTSLTGS